MLLVVIQAVLTLKNVFVCVCVCARSVKRNNASNNETRLIVS